MEGNLSEEERNRLDYLDNKIRAYPTRFPDPDHRAEASILILGALDQRKSIAFCGFPSEKNPTGFCGRWKYCPYCAGLAKKKRGRAFLVPLARQIEAGARILWVTVSFDAHETFGFQFQMEGTGVVRDIWEACSLGIKSVIEDKNRQGALICWELAVHRIVPDIRVIPHAHALVICDGDQQFLTEKIAQEVARNLPEEAAHLVPDIKIEDITKDTSAMRRLFYMTKPFTVINAYKKAARQVREGRSTWKEVNMAAVEIIYGYEDMTAGAHMFRPCGIFHHKTRGSIRIAARDQEHYEGVFDEICERARSVWDSEEPSQEDLLRLEDVLEPPEEQPRG